MPVALDLSVPSGSYYSRRLCIHNECFLRQPCQFIVQRNKLLLDSEAADRPVNCRPHRCLQNFKLTASSFLSAARPFRLSADAALAMPLWKISLQDLLVIPVLPVTVRKPAGAPLSDTNVQLSFELQVRQPERSLNRSLDIRQKRGIYRRVRNLNGLVSRVVCRLKPVFKVGLFL